MQAIQSAYAGRSSIAPRIAKLMIQMINLPSPHLPHLPEGLSEAERRILTYVAQGWQNKEIAYHLGLSQTTVHAHVSRILSKLHLQSRTQAALYALKHGLVSLHGQQPTVPTPLHKRVSSPSAVSPMLA